MKKAITLFLINLCLFSYGQQTTEELEQITLQDGSTLLVHLKKIENGYIEYLIPGNNELKIVKTDNIKSIQFHIQPTDSLPVVKNQVTKGSWQEIKLIYDPNQIGNLKRISEVNAEKGRYYGAKKKLKTEAEEALKKKAFALGGKVVLIVNEQYIREPINTYKIDGIIYK